MRIYILIYGWFGLFISLPCWNAYLSVTFNPSFGVHCPTLSTACAFSFIKSSLKLLLLLSANSIGPVNPLNYDWWKIRITQITVFHIILQQNPNNDINHDYTLTEDMWLSKVEPPFHGSSSSHERFLKNIGLHWIGRW